VCAGPDDEHWEEGERQKWVRPSLFHDVNRRCSVGARPLVEISTPRTAPMPPQL
jgi:hypothetical protein